MGITKGVLKKVTGLAQGLVTSSLKFLIKEGIIREFKTKTKGQSIFVASEFNPDLDIIGGSLFLNGQIDHELVDKIQK